MLCKHYIGPFISKPLTTPFLCLPFVLLKPKPLVATLLHCISVINASRVVVHASALIVLWAGHILIHAFADSSAFLVLWQDLADLSIDAVQGYMLPWDARRLAAAFSNVLSPEQSSYGSFEPSLFCTFRFAQLLPSGQQLSFCSFSCCLLHWA